MEHRMIRTVIALSLMLAAAGARADELAALRTAFANVYESLQATGGVADEDTVVLESLRDRAAAYNQRFADDAVGLALELQLSQWLGDDEHVDDLFPRLAQVTGDVKVGLAWIRYHSKQEDRPQLAYVHSRLAEIFPDNIGILGGWAAHFKDANLYGRAIEILEGADLDPAEDPEPVIMLSECLFAEQRFAEALEVLESIPAEAVADKPSLRSAIERDVPIRQEYVVLWDQELQIRSAEAAADDLPRVELITVQGPIILELFENQAPNTVANFISLAESGSYDGTTFHRVIPNFMSQGGDPNTKPGGEGTPGTGGPGYRIPDECTREGARMHFTGSLAMGNTGSPDTGGSQFYITHTSPAHLNGKHTVFGRVLGGLDVARSIQVGDVLDTVTVIRKRDHEYTPQTLPLVEPEPPVTLDSSLESPDKAISTSATPP
jgi:cyclophilin family peptidyl-prolyl cis-trans isomerase